MYLTKYIAKRVFWGIITLFIVLFISFWLLHLLNVEVPMDKTLAQIQAARREAMGYNKPIVVQFQRWITAFINGNWGTSYFIEIGIPVLDIFKRRLVPTLAVNIYSELLILPLGILLGIFAALKKNKWQDYMVSSVFMIFMTLPSFVWCFFWMYTICFLWPIFPLQVYSLSEAGSWFSMKMLYSMIPAILSLTLGAIARLARQVRAELSDQISTDYMLLARAKGLTYRQAIFRHSLKNAFVPIFPGIIAGFIFLLSGSIFVETIFGIPGVGKLMVQSITFRDYDVFMACMAFFGIIGMVASIIYDISFGIIDPRIKMGAK